MDQMTDKQREVFEFFESNKRTIYPTIRTVAKHFGVYPSTIQSHIDALRMKGIVISNKRSVLTQGAAE